MIRRPGIAVLLAALLVSGCGDGRTDSPQASEVTSSPIVNDLLRLWDDADLVCLGEIHGSVLDSELRNALVSDPRLADTVDVIVVEFVNPHHQDLLDRLVLKGEPLSREQLRPAWRDAGLGVIWDLEIYESCLRRVAEANAGRSRSERIPVIGAALPVDWSSVEGPEDLVGMPDRLAQFENVLRREVLDPGLKGLAIFGAGHCERRAPSLLSRLVAGDRERVRAVLPFEGAEGRAAGRVVFGPSVEPRLIPVRGTPFATVPSGGMFFEGHARAGARLADLADAIVDHGERQDRLLEPDPNSALDAEAERRLDLLRRARAIADDSLGSG